VLSLGNIESLLITIAIETMVFCTFQFCSLKAVASVTLVNVFTNPLLNYLLWLNSRHQFFSPLGLLISLEFFVIVVEALLLAYVFCEKWSRFVGTSFLMNLASAVLGIVFLAGFAAALT